MAFPTSPVHGKIARIGFGASGLTSAAGSTIIDYTSRWTINWTKDVSVFGRQGQEYKESYPGQAAYTGSGEMTFVNSSEQATLIGYMVTTDATVTLSTGPLSTKVLKFFVDSTHNYLACSAINFTNVTFDAPVGDLVKCSFTFTGSGPIRFVEYTP